MKKISDIITYLFINIKIIATIKIIIKKFTLLYIN